MAFLSSTDKQSSQNTVAEQEASFAPVIRTLEGDLKNITGGQNKEDAFEPSRASVNPFSTGTGGQAQPKQALPKNETPHPFSITPPVTQTSPTFSPPQAPVLENGLTSLLPSGALLSDRPVTRHTPAWMLYSIAIAVVCVVLGGGVWYFFFNQEKSASEPVVPVDVIEKSSETNTNLPPKQAPFSLDNPNYLSFNTETVSSLDIRKTLSETAERIKTADIDVPVEFFVTDQNNNPLAFSRFAFLLDLNLDADLLALTQETFSLYVYNDDGRVRFGLALRFKTMEAATDLLTKTETDMPYALRALILEPGVTVAKKSMFRSASYNRFAVRFSNIDVNQNISLDYALDNNRLFLGTSKNTLRVLLDTYAR